MNKLIDIQEVVFNQLKRLDDDELMEYKSKEEIERANVISNNAQTYIKAVNIDLKIMEYANKTDLKVKYLYNELGLLDKYYENQDSNL